MKFHNVRKKCIFNFHLTLIFIKGGNCEKGGQIKGFLTMVNKILTSMVNKNVFFYFFRAVFLRSL